MTYSLVTPMLEAGLHIDGAEKLTGLAEYRNGGLGTALMGAIIKWARANPILELIWLQVYAQNHAAVSLYHKMGFVNHGIIPGFFKHQNQYYDNLTMSMRVK